MRLTFKFRFYFPGFTLAICDNEISISMDPTPLENAANARAIYRQLLANVLGQELYDGAFDDNGVFIHKLLAHENLQMLEFFWAAPESFARSIRLMGNKRDIKYGPGETTLGRNYLQQLVETSSLTFKRIP